MQNLKSMLKAIVSIINRAKQCATIFLMGIRCYCFFLFYCLIDHKRSLRIEIGPSLKLRMKFTAVLLKFLNFLGMHHCFLEIGYLGNLLLVERFDSLHLFSNLILAFAQLLFGGYQPITKIL